MNFPSEILPSKRYKAITCDLSDFYLIRHFTLKENVGEPRDSVTGFIKQAYLCSPKENMADLSTSLLGIFQIPFINIALTSVGLEKYNEYCDPNQSIELPEYETDFIIKNDRLYWVILINDIHNTEVDYTKSDLPFKAKCIIQHSPMLWNYWHFSIRWKTEDGFWHELSKKEKDKLSKRLAHSARAHITMFAKIEEPNYYNLPEVCFRA